MAPTQNRPSVTATRENVQDAPALYLQQGQPVAALKVDTIRTNASRVLIEGWSTGNCELQLMQGEVAVEQQVTRKLRPDVADSLRIPETGDGFGFLLKGKSSREAQGEFALQAVISTAEGVQEFIHPLLLPKDARSQGTSKPRAIGFLEAASTSSLTGETVVVGWGVHGPDVELWLENEAGDEYAVADAFRMTRQDVNDAHGKTYGHTIRDAGFIARLDGMLPGDKVKLIARDADGASITLSETACGQLEATPAGAARWLFGLGTPTNQLHARLPLIDIPVIQKLIEHNQQTWTKLPIESRELGDQVDDPLVSVVVPLYGRIDFVEHQLIEFVRDPWFAAHAELIYVVDDPAMVDPFRAQAEALFRLYRLPFKWLWGSVNRGFSGANNLGASVSRGEYMLFLNSDAFPQKPGWLQELLKVLQARPDVAAVAPRLVFADGSIQHAAMQFMRREELGVWINHHPYMGLDPSLDPHKALSIVPAVTGACIALRRSDFESVGGWDTGYLIGDFEDSDLCLKLRSAGKSIAYLPTTQLTHLERQSFRLLGQGEFRTRVVIFNAFRHQSRWGHLIESSSSEGTNSP
jgi:O-antigen biosynthesis protein